MLPMLMKRFSAERLPVHPELSALQVFCAKARLTWQDARILSGHGRSFSVFGLGHAVRTNEKLILFCDAEHSAGWIAAALVAEGLGDLERIVGERLSHPDEQITRSMAMALQSVPFDALNRVMVINPAPLGGLPAAGLPDGAFVQVKTPMTKREIRVQILAELALPIDAVVWDVGAGTGSVAIECARQVPHGTVYAIERDESALSLIRRNAVASCANNLKIIEGVAPDCLSGLPEPTHVFIGGSGGHMDGIFEAIECMEKPVRVVTTAVTLEGERAMIDRMARYADFGLSQISVSRMEKIGGYHMMKAQNPVRIAAGTKERK